MLIQIIHANAYMIFNLNLNESLALFLKKFVDELKLRSLQVLSKAY